MLRRSFAAAIVLVATGFAARAAEIALACSGLGKEYEICQEGAEAWAKATGNTVRLVSTPNSATERLALYQQLLAARRGRHRRVPDRRGLARHPRPTTSSISPPNAQAMPRRRISRRSSRTTPSTASSSRMPWFTDAGLLYYRKDLLETIRRRAAADLAGARRDGARRSRTASARPATTKMWGFVFQGKAYEGLTCNALEWIDSYGGGTIVDADGRRSRSTIRRPPRRSTLAAELVGTIAPRGRAQLQRGGGARRLPVRQRRLHAQLALCLGAGAGRGQPGQGQDRRRAAAEGRRRRQAPRHARRLAARGLAILEERRRRGRPRRAT